MEAIRKIPERSIVIFGMIAALLYIFAAIYSPYASIFQNGSILSASIITVVIMLPLVLFFAASWLRLTDPPLRRAGNLIAAVSGVVVIVLQIYYYSVWMDVILPADGYSLVGKLKTASLLLKLANTVLYVGIILIGVSFLSRTNRKFTKAGLANVIGAGIGCLSFPFSASGFFLQIGMDTESANTLLFLFALAARIPLMVLLYSIFKDQKIPENELKK